MITPSPLPALMSSMFQELELHGQRKAIGACETILRAEARAAYNETDESVVLARLVGYFLLEFYAWRRILGDPPFIQVIDVTPSSRGRENIEYGCSVVFAVGQRYRDCLIRPYTFGHPLYDIQHLSCFEVRRLAESYHSPHPYTSPPSDDTLEEVVEDCVESSGDDYWTARKKVCVDRAAHLH